MKQLLQNDLEDIRKMVIHGLYATTLKHGYRPDVFVAFKEEQNRLFDNYEKNQLLFNTTLTEQGE